MRFHANYEQLQLWNDAQALRSFARPERIVAVRLEPVIRQRIPSTIADITFRTDTGHLCIPAILVDAPQVVLREADRFIWPLACKDGVEAACAAELESYVMPWLRSITLGRPLTHEVIRHYGERQDREAFESARARRYVGATMLKDVVQALGPYVYIARYVHGEVVAVQGAPDAMQGATYLTRFADVTVCGADAADRAAAEDWFDPSLGDFKPEAASVIVEGPQASSGGSGAPVVRVGVDAANCGQGSQITCAQAFPTDFLFTYGTLYGPAGRTFCVEARPAPKPSRPVYPKPHISGGGSGGRILFGLRSDWTRAPDADTESALQLAALLRSEGLVVDVTGEPSGIDYASYDVVHVFNVLEVKTALNFLARAKAAGVPAILTANFLDIIVDRTWGAQTAPTCFRQEMDEANIGVYLGFMKRRALLLDGWDDRTGGPFPEFTSLVKEAFKIADLVIAESTAEEALLRGWGRSKPTRVIEPLISPVAGGAVAPPLGRQPFVLVHGMLEPRNNQLMAIRAARLAGVHLVLAGGDGDIEYAARVREIAGPGVTLLEAPDEGQLHWLYASASTILDPSWYSFGTGRLWSALLSGARVCASDLGWGPLLWKDLVVSADPASPEQMAVALRQGDPPSLGARTELAQRLDATVVLKNTIDAYLSLASASSTA